jgi:hypothetical protein
MLEEQRPATNSGFAREWDIDVDPLPARRSTSVVRQEPELVPGQTTEAPDDLQPTSATCSPSEAPKADLDAAAGAEALGEGQADGPAEVAAAGLAQDLEGSTPGLQSPSPPPGSRAPAKKRLKFIGAGDLLSWPAQVQRWVWDGWIPWAKVGIVAAVSDHGKTAYLLQLAVGVAAGLPVLGIPTTPSPSGVLFYSAEDDAGDLQRRLELVLEGMAAQGHLTPVDKANIDRNLVFAEPSHDVADLRFEVTEAEICNQLSAMRVAGVVPAMVIVETLSAVSDGDENRTGTTRGLWASARAIAARHDVTVLLSHHYRKDAGGGRSGRSGIAERLGEDSLRGAGANGAAARFVIQMGLPTAREAEDLGLDPLKALNKGFAILRASKLKATKPAMLFVERVDVGQPGQHTWVTHPDSDQIIADLLRCKAKAKAEDLDLQDLLLLTIYRQGPSPDREMLKAIFAGNPNPATALTNALNRLRNRGDLQARALSLTPQGTAKAKTLAEEFPEEEGPEETAGL